MPSGRTHTTVDLILLLSILVALFSWSGVVIDWVGSTERFRTCVIGFCLAYLFSVFFLSPDLDLDRCRARSRWGIFGVLWYPYSKVFRHRGISHSIIFGMVTRILYLILIVALLQLGLRRFLGVDIGLSVERSIDFYAVGAVAVGLYIPDAMHIILDRLI
ncbi:MAG: DUF2227 family putative metal-binding protein [Candidatus Latescibacteria bacterium]|nr:DUF2227 family putative metal-binding protein [Candidatus Latescibacterota bacterium]